MGALEVFAIRLILSIIFAFIVCRFFFRGTPMINVFGLAAIMLGLAYLFEYFRRKGKGGTDGN